MTSWCLAELLMGRCIQCNLPQTLHLLIPKWPHLEKFRNSNSEAKQKQTDDYDTRNGNRSLPDIPSDTTVWVATGHYHIAGRVLGPANTPRSYMVDTDSGQIRPNRSHLTIRPDSQPSKQENVGNHLSRSPVQTRTCTGTPIFPPDRLRTPLEVMEMWCNCSAVVNCSYYLMVHIKSCYSYFSLGLNAHILL